MNEVIISATEIKFLASPFNDTLQFDIDGSIWHLEPPYIQRIFINNEFIAERKAFIDKLSNAAKLVNSIAVKGLFLPKELKLKAKMDSLFGE